MTNITQPYRRFFWKIRGVQAGKINPKQVGKKLSQVAEKLEPEVVKTLTEGKQLTKSKLNEVISVLKECSQCEISQLKEDDNKSIAKTFNQKGNFEQYIAKFSGLEFKPKEMEAVANMTDPKPTKQDKFELRFETSDDFQNSSTTVVKKLREGTNLVFTAFQKNTQGNDEIEADPKTGQQENEDEIMVYKSTAYTDEIEGGQILSQFVANIEM